MVFIEKFKPLYLESDVSTGRVETTLNPPVDIPVDAKNVTVELVSATLHNTFLNVTSNANFSFTYDTASSTNNSKNITVKTGAYNLESLQEAFDEYLFRDPDLPDTLFELVYNPATQRVSIRVDFTQQGVTDLTSVTIKFSDGAMTSGPLAALLGFADVDRTFTYSGSVPSAVTIVGTKAPGFLTGPDTIQVRSDMIVGAVDRFGHNTNILAEFPAPAKGARVHFEEAFSMPHEFAAANGRIDKVRARLTDQDGNQLKPVERPYQLQILIKYLMWVPTPEKTMAGLVGAGAGYRGY